jgi:formate--tetrahydrofolate ligase
MAKTQNSLSDDAKKLGRPADFTVTVRDAKLAAGAGSSWPTPATS